jgi:hypothetical protein
MGNVIVLDKDGNEQTLNVSTDVEAQVLALREVAMAMRKRTNG